MNAILLPVVVLTAFIYHVNREFIAIFGEGCDLLAEPSASAEEIMGVILIGPPENMKARRIKMKTVKFAAVLFISSIALIGCTDSPEKAYEKALKVNSVDAFKKFIGKYPNSPLTQRARNQIQGIKETLYATGIREMCFSKDTVALWDKILQEDNADLIALAMKGVAEATKDNTETAKSIFKECVQKTNKTSLSSYVLKATVFSNGQMTSLHCPLPASIAKNALLIKSGKQYYEANQFFYSDPSNGPYVLFHKQAMVFLSNVPNQNPKEIFRKIMQSNLQNLGGA